MTPVDPCPACGRAFAETKSEGAARWNRTQHTGSCTGPPGPVGRPPVLSPEVVGRIVAQRAAGASLGTIAAGLTEDGVPPARGAMWYRSSVAWVLARASALRPDGGK
jgi:hypothetical protein